MHRALFICALWRQKDDEDDTEFRNEEDSYSAKLVVSRSFERVGGGEETSESKGQYSDIMWKPQFQKELVHFV